jgi:DNA-binding XRE family transcriptional regulator
LSGRALPWHSIENATGKDYQRLFQNDTYRLSTYRHPTARFPWMARSPEDQAILSAFGARVRKLRKARKLSQEALGELVGIDKTHVGSIERGEKSPGVVIVYRIAVALDESFQNLLLCPEMHRR